MSGHERYAELVAAHVLGALDPAERAELDQHLRDCEPCRREVVELAPIPALLARLDAEEVETAAAGSAPDRLVAAVRADVARVARSRRRWRRATAAAAAAAAVLALVWLVDDDAAPRRFDGVALEVELASTAASGEVVADERDWGTYVWVTADGLPRRDGYTLWVVDTAGRWERAGTFAPTPDGSVALGGSTRLPMDGIDRVVVTSDDREDEILTAR